MKTVRAVVAVCILLRLIWPGEAAAGAADRSRCISPDARSDNEAWSATSWKFFNDRKYDAAIANVNACLANWLPGAQKMQSDIESRGAKCPPVGPPDETTRKSTLSNGLLNDVATSLWIKGRSHEANGNRGAAKDAFASCAQLYCARTWDDRGWFWDPAGDCSIRLRSFR